MAFISLKHESVSMAIMENRLGRLGQLDAVRGIAALIVVFNHYAQTIPLEVRQLAAYPLKALELGAWGTPWPWLRFTPLRLLVDGHAAVIIFFVLSGFVLAMPVQKESQPRFWPFVIKRFCRVFLPFATIIILVAAAYAFVQPEPSPSAGEWVNTHLPSLDKISLTGHLLMTGGDMSLNPVMWTLVHEMRMSIILPLIFLLIRRFGGVWTVSGCLVVSILCSFGMTDSISGSWQATAHFMWMFSAGCALSFYREKLCALAATRGHRVTALLWVLALGLLAWPFDRVWSDFLFGVGASLVIVLCLPSGRVSGLLKSPVPIWLGRVSYSLYLIHLPILVLALSGNSLPLSVIFVMTLIGADLAFVLIERPAHKLGIFLGRSARNS
jgi:peptidoglycan/LPS O-acetylase OafA/YrhL